MALEVAWIRATFPKFGYTSHQMGLICINDKPSGGVNVEAFGGTCIRITLQRNHHDEGRFLKEERNLITAIAISIGEYIERKQMEDALRESEVRNRLILQAVGEGIYGLDLEGNTTFINAEVSKLIGWNLKDLIDKPAHDILHHTRPDGSPYPREECHIHAAFKDGKVHNITDEVFWRKDGSSFPVEYTSTPVFEGDALAGAVVVFRDITERKSIETQLEQKVGERTQELVEEIGKREQIEKQIKTSLAEKEVLIREIHHRVKNNLQVVSSLLSIQRRRETDEPILRKLDECARRIKTMARVHENLYLSKNLSSLGARDFLKSIIDDAKESARGNGTRISIQDDIEDILMSLDQAVPTGQIVSELVSNSMKYAFPEDQTGTIKISLHRLDDDRLELVVEDDGVGLPEGIEVMDLTNMGLMLVDALVQQLSGELTLNGSVGTRCCITYKDSLA